MQLTGNPFVDTGLMVLTTLAGKDHANGSALAKENRPPKSYTMVFGTNGSLAKTGSVTLMEHDHKMGFPAAKRP
jgi:hypothetical protein